MLFDSLCLWVPSLVSRMKVIHIEGSSCATVLVPAKSVKQMQEKYDGFVLNGVRLNVLPLNSPKKKGAVDFVIFKQSPIENIDVTFTVEGQ